MKAVSVLPFLRWFPTSRDSLKSDVLAGLTVALLLVPQSMAYAQLAGLPPYYGLCTAFVPTILAALFGLHWLTMLIEDSHASSMLPHTPVPTPARSATP